MLVAGGARRWQGAARGSTAAGETERRVITRPPGPAHEPTE